MTFCRRTSGLDILKQIVATGGMKMDFITTVRVLVKETEKPVIGVRVALFDRDQNSPDDLLGIGTTNSFGEVDFRYRTGDFADGLGRISDDGFKLLNRDIVPDLYVIVYNRSDEPIVSTRDETVENKAALHLLVYIDQQAARDHQLLTPVDK